MRGWNYVELERYCESLKEERDKYRQEAMQERELTEDIVAEREALIIENERVVKALHTIETDLISGHPKFALETAARVLHSLKRV